MLQADRDQGFSVLERNVLLSTAAYQRGDEEVLRGTEGNAKEDVGVRGS